MMLQVIRRSVQMFALVIALALPILSLYAHYRAARTIHDPVLMSGMRGAAMTRWVHPVVDGLDDPQTFLDANKGTLWSMRLQGINWTDPLAAAETVAATKHVHWPLIASIVIPGVLALLFGKIFCSWICPGYLLFELTGKLRKLLRLAEIEPGELKFAHVNKYVVLFAGLALAAATSAPLFALVYPPAVISRALHAWVFGTALSGMVVLLALIVAVEVFFSPRWWCRTVCPGGALYGLLGWLRPVRIRLRTEACTGCKACIPVCEAGLNPITQSASIECDNCGVCLRHCGDKALYYTIGLPEIGTRSTRHGHSSNATLPNSTARRAATMLSGLTAILVLPQPAVAHHILGLPHYSYKENYPQRPTLEYPATTGPYEVLLTAMPGIPVPGETANLAFYIKDRAANRVYSEEVSVRVLQTSTFGDNVEIVPATQRTPIENQYKFHVTFPADGEYVVELSMPVEGRLEVIPFAMIAGQPNAAASFVVASAGGFVLLLVVVRAIQKKRRRRQAAAQGPRAVRENPSSHAVPTATAVAASVEAAA